jgi:hypothetical protein
LPGFLLPSHNRGVKKKIQQRLEALPVQHRAAKVDSFDYDKRTVTFALTSETPVERWYGQEIPFNSHELSSWAKAVLDICESCEAAPHDHIPWGEDL